MSTHDDHSSKDDHSKTDPNEGVEQNQSFAWVIYVVIILLLILGVYSLVSSTKKQANQTSSRSESTQQSSQPSSSTQQTVIKVTRFEPNLIHLKPDSLVKFDVPGGVKAIRYRKANTPYCVKNLAEEHCSIDTEDVSNKFKNERSEAAVQLFLKSQQDTGRVIVELEYD